MAGRTAGIATSGTTEPVIHTAPDKSLGLATTNTTLTPLRWTAGGEGIGAPAGTADIARFTTKAFATCAII